MPGTPEEYDASPKTAEAESLIDAAIAEGDTSGSEIVNRLESSGFRVYAQEGEADAMGDSMMDEFAAEMDAEASPEEAGSMMDEFAAEMDAEEMPMPEASPGRQDVILEAVRFGIDEDKKKKAAKDSE